MTTRTFILNGTFYRTDRNTFSMMKSLLPSAMETNDWSAVQAALFLGLKVGRITELGK